MVWLQTDWEFRSPKCPIPHGGPGHPSNTMLLGTTQVSLPNNISFCPTALAGCKNVTDDTNTDRWTDHATVTSRSRQNRFQWCYLIMILAIFTMHTKNMRRETLSTGNISYQKRQKNVIKQNFNSCFIKWVQKNTAQFHSDHESVTFKIKSENHNVLHKKLTSLPTFS